MKHMIYSHYIPMFFIMIVSGFLSTMNLWAERLDDIRFSLNDVYMVFLMTGWMFIGMGLYYMDTYAFLFGALMVFVNIWCIRTQWGVSTKQYITGMIPHHSMAILMSKKLLEKEKLPPSLQKLVEGIVSTQRNEIEFMKQVRV